VLASAVGIAAGPASATTSGCDSGMFPVTERSFSSLRVACVVASGDLGNAGRVTDFTNVTWHAGASRSVKVTATAASAVLNVQAGHIGIPGTFSSGTFGAQTGDENRVVEAGFNKLTPGSFIVAESGTGPGGTITLSQPVPKSATLTLLIENGPGRGVADAVVTNGSTTLTSATANFVDGSGISSDVGLSISGTSIPPGTTIASVTNATTVELSNAATADRADSVIVIGGTTNNSTHRLVNDLTVNGSNIYSAMANFEKTDIGLLVKGIGLPANAYILTAPSATHATISAPATTAAADIVATIGLASATAPLKETVDPVTSVQTEFTLDPDVIDGAPECGLGIQVGASVQGVWNSPSKFALSPTATDPPYYFNDTHLGLKNPIERSQTMLASGPFIGQIAFRTSIIDFAAYVQETPTGSAVISLPFLPAGLGQCAGTSVATMYTFNGDIMSQSLAPPGYGKPGSGGFRRTIGLNAAGTPVTSSASYENFSADSAHLAGASTSSTTDQVTATAHGLNEGDVVNVVCDGTGGHCTDAQLVAAGLKSAKPYYVHVIDANHFQVALKPFDAANGVPFVKVDIKSNLSGMDVFYNVFNPVYGPISDSCTIARPAPMNNLAGTFPCSAG
jgi:hypothetical protein